MIPLDVPGYKDGMVSDPDPGKVGKFITFEGGEGSGKSTQVKILGARLRECGIDVVETREPGGTPEAELIREMLVTGAVSRWTPLSETFLNYAARHEHLETIIRPDLKQGKWIISDRFADSTLAYQGTFAGASSDTMRAIEILHHLIVGGTSPDLTFILDLPVENGLKRAESRGEHEDRYEKMGITFHERIRRSFLAIAKRAPERCVVIDGAQSVEKVSARIWDIARSRWVGKLHEASP